MFWGITTILFTTLVLTVYGINGSNKSVMFWEATIEFCPEYTKPKSIKRLYTLPFSLLLNSPIPQFKIYSNRVVFRNDNTCLLPMAALDDQETGRNIGKWKVFSKNRKNNIEIVSKNEFFEGTYEILDLYRVKDIESSGELIKVTLQSKTFTISCTRPYYPLLD